MKINHKAFPILPYYTMKLNPKKYIDTKTQFVVAIKSVSFLLVVMLVSLFYGFKLLLEIILPSPFLFVVMFLFYFFFIYKKSL